jgi:hypothetical protein
MNPADPPVDSGAAAALPRLAGVLLPEGSSTMARV